MELNEQIFRKSHLFQDFNDKDWDRVKALIHLVKVQKGEIIFSEDEKAHGFYMIQTGRVKVFKLSPDGKEHILRIFSKGEHFAEASVFSGGKFPANASALTDSTLAYFPSTRFLHLVKETPEIALFMLSALSRYMHHLVNVVEELSLKNVPARLAKFLFDRATLPGNFAQERHRELKLPMTKSEIALYLGTTSETLSRILGKMKRLKIISEKNKRILIHKEDALQEIIRGQKL